MGKHKAQPHAAAVPPGAAAGCDVDLPAGAVHIDGSMLEGGGQILRNATALSAITGTPVSVTKIRAGRKNPGLSPQHLTGLRLVEAMCQGHLGGGQVRSSHISLAPGRLQCGRHLADTGTAGSCTLMLQQALPCMLFASAPPPAAQPAGRERPAAGGPPSSSGAGSAGAAGGGWSELDLRGGTDAAFAPPVGYLEHVLAPTLRRLLPDACGGLSVRVARRGFYPRGGGEVAATARALAPGEVLPPLDVTRRGVLSEVRVLAFSAGRVQHDDAQRMAAAAAEAVQDALRAGRRRVARGAPLAAEQRRRLHQAGGGGGTDGSAGAHQGSEQSGRGAAASSSGGDGSSSGGGGASGGVRVVMDVVREGESTAAGDGGGLLLVAESDAGRLWGASALWERGVPPGSAGRAAAEELLEALEGGACVDQWMQDQLIIYMALAAGTSRMVCAEPTLHTRTAMVVAEAMLPGAKFSVTRLQAAAGGGGGGGAAGGGDGGLYLIECQGAGVKAV